MFAVNGILFNHESPRRGETFVTRKITRAVSKIVLGLQEKVLLGNLDAKRDWGHAKDYVEAMWLTLQVDSPEDWVIATGYTTSIRDFVKLCFNYFGIVLKFSGTGINEKGFIKSCLKKEFQLEIGKEVLGISSKYFRPSEVDLLIGDSSKAKKKLGWTPKYDLKSLIDEMIASDYNFFNKNK